LKNNKKIYYNPANKIITKVVWRKIQILTNMVIYALQLDMNNIGDYKSSLEILCVQKDYDNKHIKLDHVYSEWIDVSKLESCKNKIVNLAVVKYEIVELIKNNKLKDFKLKTVKCTFAFESLTFKEDAKIPSLLISELKLLKNNDLKGINAQELKLKYKKPEFKTTIDEQNFENELIYKIENNQELNYGEFLYAIEELYLPKIMINNLKLKPESQHKIWTASNSSFGKYVKKEKEFDNKINQKQQIPNLLLTELKLLKH